MSVSCYHFLCNIDMLISAHTKQKPYIGITTKHFKVYTMIIQWKPPTHLTRMLYVYISKTASNFIHLDIKFLFQITSSHHDKFQA